MNINLTHGALNVLDAVIDIEPIEILTLTHFLLSEERITVRDVSSVGLWVAELMDNNLVTYDPDSNPANNIDRAFGLPLIPTEYGRGYYDGIGGDSRP